MQHVKLALALATGAFVLASPARAGDDPVCTPLQLQWSAASYSLGQQIALSASGVPGTFGIMFVNADPGPLIVPGIGTFGVGAGPGLVRFPIKPIPESGVRLYTCDLACEDVEMADQTFYVQALSVAPGETKACISNVAVLVVDDQPCVAEGCTPGIWKNKHELWADTGYDPADDFDTTFGVDLLDPDESLGEAASHVGGILHVFTAHATAALLSASHPDVEYPLSEAQVIQRVQDAVLSGDLETAKDELDQLNNSGCPL